MSNQPFKEEVTTDDARTPEVQEKPATPPQTEDEMRALYIEQQRLRSCPGCGEGFEVF